MRVSNGPDYRTIAGVRAGTPWPLASLTWSLAAMFLVLLATGCRSTPRDALTQHMVDSRQLAMRGHDAMQCGRWEEAQQLFDQAKTACPANERARAGFANTLWQQGQRAAAITEMQEAVRLSGGDAEMQVRLGEMRLAAGDIDGAHVCANSAIQTQWQSPDAWGLAGDVARARGQLDDALRNYHRALACQPRMPAVQLAVAEIYESQERPLRALATLDSMLEHYSVEQAPVDLLTRRGVALKRLGRLEDAIESLTAAWKQGNAAPDVALQLAECQSLAGHQASAILTVQDALRRDPNHSGLQVLSARLSVPDVRMAARGSLP